MSDVDYGAFFQNISNLDIFQMSDPEEDMLVSNNKDYVEHNPQVVHEILSLFSKIIEKYVGSEVKKRYIIRLYGERREQLMTELSNYLEGTIWENEELTLSDYFSDLQISSIPNNVPRLTALINIYANQYDFPTEYLQEVMILDFREYVVWMFSKANLPDLIENIQSVLETRPAQLPNPIQAMDVPEAESEDEAL